MGVLEGGREKGWEGEREGGGGRREEGGMERHYFTHCQQ